MERKPDEYLKYLMSLPDSEYQKELGRLLIAVLDVAAETPGIQKKQNQMRDEFGSKSKTAR